MVGRVSRHLARIGAAALLLLSACPNPLLEIVKREVANFAGQPEIQVSRGALVIPSGGTADLGAGILTQAKLVIFTIQNLGSATLTLSGNPVIVGDSSFSIASLPYTSIDGGQNSTFIVEFQPFSNGAKTATLTINNNDADEGTYTITLAGMGVGGVEPDINVLQGSSIVDPAHPYDFGGVRVNATKDVVFTIENIGTENSNLTLNSNPDLVNIIGGVGAFSVLSLPDSSPIPYLGNTSFTLRFKPNAVGPVSATVEIYSNDPDENPYTFTINGSGLEPDILVRQGGMELANGTGSYAFPDVPADGNNEATSTAVSFTIENTGSYALAISGITLSAGDTGDFDLSSRYSSPVPVGGTTTFTITFDPLSRGVKTATVSIASDDPDENPYTFEVTGTGAFAPKVYWVNRGNGTIVRANLNGTNQEGVLGGLPDPVGLAIDQINNMIYWTEYGNRRIMRAGLDGSEQRQLVNTNAFPFGITLDVPNNTMYWAEYGLLSKAALDGTGYQPVPTPDQALGIAVDGADSLYWSGMSGQIWAGTTNPFAAGSPLTPATAGYPAGLVLDTASGHLYWAEKGGARIVRWLLGFGIDYVYSTMAPLPNFIALDTVSIPNKIYWTEQDSNGIWRANLDGTNIEMIVGGQPTPYGIALDLVD